MNMTCSILRSTYLCALEIQGYEPENLRSRELARLARGACRKNVGKTGEARSKYDRRGRRGDVSVLSRGVRVVLSMEYRLRKGALPSFKHAKIQRSLDSVHDTQHW